MKPIFSIITAILCFHSLAMPSDSSQSTTRLVLDKVVPLTTAAFIGGSIVYFSQQLSPRIPRVASAIDRTTSGTDRDSSDIVFSKPVIRKVDELNAIVADHNNHESIVVHRDLLQWLAQRQLDNERTTAQSLEDISRQANIIRGEFNSLVQH
jgi:hypothetical protein